MQFSSDSHFPNYHLQFHISEFQQSNA